MYNVRHVRPSVYDLWTYGLSCTTYSYIPLMIMEQNWVL